VASDDLACIKAPANTITAVTDRITVRRVKNVANIEAFSAAMTP
jgi:hypothetical protein